MLRLIALFLAFALMFNNGTTVALAMCQHADAQAHASALASGDQQVVSDAIAEESAGRSLIHSKAFSDGSTASVVAFVLPGDILALTSPQIGSAGTPLTDERVPPSSSIRPPLRPPLG